MFFITEDHAQKSESSACVVVRSINAVIWTTQHAALRSQTKIFSRELAFIWQQYYIGGIVSNPMPEICH